MHWDSTRICCKELHCIQLWGWNVEWSRHRYSGSLNDPQSDAICSAAQNQCSSTWKVLNRFHAEPKEHGKLQQVLLLWIPEDITEHQIRVVRLIQQSESWESISTPWSSILTVQLCYCMCQKSVLHGSRRRWNKISKQIILIGCLGLWESSLISYSASRRPIKHRLQQGDSHYV